MPNISSPLGTANAAVPLLRADALGQAAGLSIVFADATALAAACTSERANIAASSAIWPDGQPLGVAAEVAQGVWRAWNATAQHGRTVTLRNGLRVTLGAETSAVRIAAGAPGAGVGADGDISIDWAGNAYYARASGAWGAATTLYTGAPVAAATRLQRWINGLAEWGRTALVRAPLWSSTTMAQFTTVRLSDGAGGYLIQASTGGAAGGSEPAYAANAAMTDGAVTWQVTGRRSVAQTGPVPTVSPAQTSATGWTRNPYTDSARFIEPASAVVRGDLNSSSGALSQSQAHTIWDGSAVNGGFGANGYAGTIRTIEFGTDSAWIAVATINDGQAAAGDGIRVWCDDQPVNEALIIPTDNVTRYQLVDWAGDGKRERVWRIDMPGRLLLRGITTQAGSTFHAVPKSGLVGVMLGDSYHNTVIYAAGPPALGMPQQGPDILAVRALRAAGVRYIADACIGGTGYVKRDAANRFNVQQVLENNTFGSIDADVVVIAAGYNDGDTGSGVSTVQATAAALASWQAARTRWPNAVIVVIGPWSGPKSALSSMVAMDAALQAQFSAWADPLSAWESPITGASILAGSLIAGSEAWTMGSGYVGATTGAGNSDWATAPDGSHPSPAGAAHIYVPRVASAVRRALERFLR